MPLTVYRKGKKPSAPIKSPAVIEGAKHELVGKTGMFPFEDVEIAGVVKSVSDEQATIAIALPDTAGILHQTDSEIIVAASDVEAFKGVVGRVSKVRSFDQIIPFTTDNEKMLVISTEEGGQPTDYRNVKITGLASTFQETTPEDRDGDYVVQGAFNESINQFKENPVMLIDHHNSVKAIAGSYTKLGQSDEGLMVEGSLSNAPGLTDVRFLVAEGHLKAFSMGGMFFYRDDHRGIEKVDLFEVSLVAVPANQDALFQVRGVTLEDAKRLTLHRKRHGEFSVKLASA